VKSEERLVPPGLQLFYDVSRAIADGLHHKILFILKYIVCQHFSLKTRLTTGMPCFIPAKTRNFANFLNISPTFWENMKLVPQGKKVEAAKVVNMYLMLTRQRQVRD
jgi:hypothetical protein